MSVGYSSIAAVAAAASMGHAQPTFGQRDSGVKNVFGVLSACAAVMLSFGGQSVLLEVQSTLQAPGSATRMIQGAQ